MRIRLPTAFAAFLLLIGNLTAKPIHHYLYFAQDREKLRTTAAMLELKKFEGAQIAYSWRQLEAGKDEYDFSMIREDLEFLRSKGKKLFIQIQDVSFSEKYVPVPKYLLIRPEFNGGADRQYMFKFIDHVEQNVTAAGWMARRWDPAVRERFRLLLQALGKEFDGKIEGINLAETAYDNGDTGKLFPKGFSFDAYRDGIIANMKAMKDAFPHSTTLVYANFMPGEWLPKEDAGHLRAVYKAAVEMGVGVGGPDLRLYWNAGLHGSYPLIKQASGKVRVGIAVQDGDYLNSDPGTGKAATVSDLIKFAKKDLRADYLFWCTEEPYFSRDLVSYLKQK
ncbi:MAG: hypothetical protein JO053_14615 [Acidobacteria bacterium]|nr:hypothetical protein [Acidobacteriota bacterium]